MTAHKPLSTWVTAVRYSAGVPVQWLQLTDVNFGDERVDARDLPEFSDGWRRQAILLDRGYRALGLVRDDSGEAVVEVDNHVRPVPVSEGAAAIIGRLEDSWPDGALSDTDLTDLAGEDKIVGYLLADRLGDEGNPPPELFRILPWNLVDELTAQLDGLLNGDQPPDDIVELGHWFTPVGSRFTAALEQLDEGLRAPDATLSRVAASALCAQLLALEDPARVPERTRNALAALAGRLGEVDPFLQFAGRRAAARLRPGHAIEEEPPVRLSTELAPAAGTETEVRTESAAMARPPFTVELVVTETGQAEITVSAPPADLGDRVSSSYGVMLIPVRVSGDDRTTRYLIPLQPWPDLSGELDVELPDGEFIEVDIDGPPVGIAEAASLDRDEVQRSIEVLRTDTGLEPWALIASRLAPAHPLRALINREIGETR
jgi:hypothetical protein